MHATKEVEEWKNKNKKKTAFQCLAKLYDQHYI